MNRYKVLIVDDEPAATQFVAKIIELKCPDFQVTATVESGQCALDILAQQPVDVVVSDVMMPEMNGVELVTALQEAYPHVCAVMVSGYQDFEYVKGALCAGAADYVLKPINPQEMSQLFERVREKLDRDRYLRCCQLLRQVSRGGELEDREPLDALFPAEHYHAAVIRKNGVIPRFSSGYSQEGFAEERQQMLVYGRDDQEMLFLCPGTLSTAEFRRWMDKEFFHLRDEECFLTMVLCEERFPIRRLPEVVQGLYKTLDNSIVTGLEQKLVLGRKKERPRESEESVEQYRRTLFLIEKQEIDKLYGAVERLFHIWEAEHRPQIWIEERVRSLFYEMHRYQVLPEWYEYWLDDAFSAALTMEELCGSIQEILRQYGSTAPGGIRDDKESVFQSISSYLKAHLSENLSVQVVCREIGISQATLNRLFRTYAGVPYKNYLTSLRIEAAKKMLTEYPGGFIKDVANYVGFNDQFYFSRVFRSIVGVSPTEYLEQLGSEEVVV